MRPPLHGVRVIEIAGLGPTPMCGMLLADLGADVVRVDRTADRGVVGLNPEELCARGKRSIAVDLKRPEGAAVVLRLASVAAVLVEGFRPGVAERLGIGPDAALAANPALVYTRASGWGQEGPLAGRAGHDIDYLAIAGVLHGIGPGDQPPTPPLALVGDMGGSAVMALGVVAAVFDAARSGRGRVLDAGVVAGAAILATPFYELTARGQWSDDRGTNLVDGGAPFYRAYRTADGEHVAVGAMEPEFYAALLELLGLDGEALPDQLDRSGWPVLQRRFEAEFLTRTRDEWAKLAEDVDACVVPVLRPTEAPSHPYNVGRRGFVDVAGVTQPAPAPRFADAPPPTPPPRRGEHTRVVLAEYGFGDDEIDALERAGVVGPMPEASR